MTGSLQTEVLWSLTESKSFRQVGNFKINNNIKKETNEKNQQVLD